MKKSILFIFLLIIFISSIAFSASDNTFNPLNVFTINLIICAIAMALGSGISYLLFKNKKSKNIVTIIIFLITFFGIKYYAMPYYYAATLATNIKKNYPIFNTIATYYPKEYNDFLSQLKKHTLENGKLNKESLALATALTNYAVEKSIPYASNKDIYNYFNINYQIEKKLFVINPLYVLAREFPTRMTQYPDLKPQSIADSDMKEMLLAKEKIIASSKNKTENQLSNAEIETGNAEITQIKTSLVEKYGDDMVKETFFGSGPFKNPAQSAELVLSLSESILAKGEEEGGLLYKILYLSSD